MSTIPESRTPHFGLRDFLFYLVPGFVVLSALALLAGIDRQTLADFSSLGASITAIILAYVLGQVGESRKASEDREGSYVPLDHPRTRR